MTNLIVAEQKFVNFNGAEIMAVKCNDGKIYAGVKWICNGMGLSKGQMQSERQRIQEDIVLSKGQRKIVLPTTGGNQEVMCIELDFLPLWHAKINAKIIKNTVVQRNIVEYQIKAKEVLSEAFVQPMHPVIQPQSIEGLIIMQAQSVKELKAVVEQQGQVMEQQKSELVILNHRMDNMDSLDTIGDLRQRLNKMIQKYARQNGVEMPEAWHKFIQTFNTAYHTNINRLKSSYKNSHGMSKISTPEYLYLVGRLEDGIRVADKMLNQELAAR
jgi:uncharacterized coiled-coil protein SlyX